MKNIKNLSELQLLIQKSVQTQTLPLELMDVILEKPPISIRERLSIYQEAYQIRLLESLRDDFSKLENFLAEEQFEKLAQNFIRTNPSTFSNLAEYSEKFPNFVKIYHKEAFELAQREWLQVLSSQAPTPAQLISFDEIQSGQAFTIQVMPSTISRQIGDIRIAYYRHNDETRSLELNLPLFKFLQFLETSKTLEELTQFAQELNLNDEHIAKTIHEWIRNGIVYCKPL